MSQNSIIKKHANEKKSTTEIYEKAYEHWISVAANVDGMLGGFAKLHVPDINASKQFICLLRKSVNNKL